MISYPAIHPVLSYAMGLDALLAAPSYNDMLLMFGEDAATHWGGVENDALQRAGDLLGGLSTKGFLHDLGTALDEASSNGCRLSDITCLAETWRRDAQAIMLSALNGFRNTEPLENQSEWRTAA